MSGTNRDGAAGRPGLGSRLFEGFVAAVVGVSLSLPWMALQPIGSFVAWSWVWTAVCVLVSTVTWRWSPWQRLLVAAPVVLVVHGPAFISQARAAVAPGADNMLGVGLVLLAMQPCTWLVTQLAVGIVARALRERRTRHASVRIHID